MRVFPGSFHYFERETQVIRQESYAPSVSVEAAWRDRRANFTLLIDTGTESTALFPRQASELFGNSYDQLNFDDPERRILIGDVGGALHAAIEVPIDLTLHDDSDAPLTASVRILVVRPNPPERSVDSGNWDTPSLLGRDLLLHFDLFVSGSTSEVYLSLPE